MTTVPAATSVSNGFARRLSPTTIAVGALVVLAIVLPFFVSGYRTAQLTQILIYAVALLGLNLLTGFSGQISLGNGAFYAVGGYVTVILMQDLKLPYWAAPPLAGVVCFAVGYVFGRSVARLEGLYLALGTFALATAMPHFLKLDALEKWTGGSMGRVFDKPTSPLPSSINDDQYIYLFCLVVAIALYVVGWNIVRGRTGRAMVAIRDQPIAAATMGVDIVFYKSATFGVSALYTGIAGSLSALFTGFISPDNFTIVVSIQFLVGVVVGGIASIMWMLFGAVFIQIAPDVANNLAHSVLPDSIGAPDVLYGVLLIGFMTVMPGGVAGVVRSVHFWLARRARAAQKRTGA